MPLRLHVERNDKDGRLTTEQWLNSMGQVTYTATYVFDAAGEKTSAQDPSSAYAYAYDLDGRLQSIDNSGTPNVPHVILTVSGALDAPPSCTTSRAV